MPNRFFRKVLRWFFLLLIGFHIYCILGLLYLKVFPPLYTAVQIQQRIEALIDGTPFNYQSSFRSYDAISIHVPHAVVAAEDTRFFEHSGIDWDAIEDALDENRTEVRGGSTISQQLVKNLFFTTHRSYVRKAMEFTITPLTELILGKDRILELYINIVEWGPGVYGIEAAAQHHYGISAKQVSRNQAARLAACLPSPKVRRPQNMSRYAGIIQSRMRVMGY